MGSDYKIAIKFDVHRDHCPVNYLSIPNSLVKPLSKLLRYPIELNNPNFEIIISAGERKFVANVLHVDSRYNGLIGNNSLLKSLNLEIKREHEFTFTPLTKVKTANEVTFELVIDKSYDPEWVSLLYSKSFSDYDSPENIIKMTFFGFSMFINNIFQIYILGKLCTIVLTFSNVSEDFPIRIDEGTNVTFDLPNHQDKSDLTSYNLKIYGMDNLLDLIKWRVLVPLSYQKFHSQNGISASRGILLWGPPGCGKSFIAKYLYNEYQSNNLKNWLHVDKLAGYDCNVPEIVLTSSTMLISDVPGQSIKNINKLFHTNSECGKVIFIDEIDGICLKRDINQNSSALIALLCEMDSCVNNNNQISIIGLTNRPNDLDLAIRRPGRFDLEIHVGVPSATQRLEILKGMLSEINHDLSNEQIETISNHCSAFVASDLKGLINKSLTSKCEAYLQQENGADMTITYEDLLVARKGLSPSGLREIYIEVPFTRWEDIGGYEDVKLLLKQSVEWPNSKRVLFTKFGIKPPRGILLYGPPGCSKTMMAKAVATSSHMNFISVKGPELFSKWVGESERSIRQLFFIARSNSPCVIFFDEIDSIGKSRQSEGLSEVGNRVLSQLLNEMDGVNSVDGLVVIGATNRPNDLDPALLRPGRFDRLIYVKLPDLAARKNIFKINLAKLSLDFGISIENLIEELATRTQGYSGAEIEAICRESALKSISSFISMHGETPGSDSLEIFVTKDHIEYAMQNVKPRTNKQLLDIYSNFNFKM